MLTADQCKLADSQLLSHLDNIMCPALLHANTVFWLVLSPIFGSPQEAKAGSKSKSTIGGLMHRANSLGEGMRSTLRRNAGSHQSLARSTGSGSVIMTADLAEQAEQASSLRTCLLTWCSPW